MRLSLRPVPSRCPFCLDQVTAGPTCQRCRARYHPDCSQLLGVCAALACAGTLSSTHEPARAAIPSSTSGPSPWHLGLAATLRPVRRLFALVIIGVAACLRCEPTRDLDTAPVDLEMAVGPGAPINAAAFAEAPVVLRVRHLLCPGADKYTSDYVEVLTVLKNTSGHTIPRRFVIGSSRLAFPRGVEPGVLTLYLDAEATRVHETEWLASGWLRGLSHRTADPRALEKLPAHMRAMLADLLPATR